MIKKIIFSILTLASCQIFSQEGSASPYSYYGMGDFRFKGTVDTRAMGGLGILADSIHVNLQNPASNTELKLTTLSIGTNFNALRFKTNTATEKAQRSTVEYLVVGIPVGKIGVTFGLMPFASVGYNISRNTTVQNAQYTGTGNINKAFFKCWICAFKKMERWCRNWL